MINPNDVNLIIFDMDGTIVASLPAVYEAIKRAFTRLGWTVNFSPEEINQFFGISTSSTKGSLYEFITPPNSHLTQEEVRDRVRAEYKDVFREMPLAYPGVKETLATLRERGYKLAQYTNASTMYLDLIMSSLQIRDYYDYIECIQDNNLTKPQIVKKIREKFGGMTAAIVGDRSHDIEAAKENGALSIGVRYGYGGDEPEGADLKIDKFTDLLDIFDRRLPIFEGILGEVEAKKPKDKAFVIGINGIDCSGKTVFAEALEKYLKSKGYPTQLINLDDFHHPKEIRYGGDNRDEDYYERIKQGYTFNFKKLIDELLAPLGRGEKAEKELTLLDLKTDKYDTVRKYKITPETIAVLEGVYLFIDQVAPYINYKVFLDIPLEECRKRAEARDAEEIVKKYDARYLPAQLKYLMEYPPDQTADLIVDNTEPGYPKTVFRGENKSI